MKLSCLIAITVTMALMVGCLIGVCIGKSLQPVVIKTGDTYEYYEVQQDEISIDPYQKV